MLENMGALNTGQQSHLDRKPRIKTVVNPAMLRLNTQTVKSFTDSSNGPVKTSSEFEFPRMSWLSNRSENMAATER